MAHSGPISPPQDAQTLPSFVLLFFPSLIAGAQSEPQIVAFQGDLILQVDSAGDVAFQAGTSVPVSFLDLKSQVDSLASRLSTQESRLSTVASSLQTLTATVSSDVSDLAGYKTQIDGRLQSLAQSIVNEANTARSNEARNANFTTSVLSAVTALSNLHSNLSSDHDVTRSLAETLESELDQLRGETQGSAIAATNALSAEVERAKRAETSITTKINDDIASLRSSVDASRVSALNALEAKIAAKPITIAPSGTLIGELAIESAVSVPPCQFFSPTHFSLVCGLVTAVAVVLNPPRSPFLHLLNWCRATAPGTTSALGETGCNSRGRTTTAV